MNTPVAAGRRPSRFRITWVLAQDLALGPAPLANRHLERMEAEGVRAVLSLCAETEAPPPAALPERFCCRRLVLPDHRVARSLELGELEQAMALLAQLRQQGPVFVHCVAAMERSPLLCLAWLVRHQKLSPQRALDYLMQLHPGTNPLPGQLALLHQLSSQMT
jgi:predicted protein tyrosine phosphatase